VNFPQEKQYARKVEHVPTKPKYVHLAASLLTPIKETRTIKDDDRRIRDAREILTLMIRPPQNRQNDSKLFTGVPITFDLVASFGGAQTRRQILALLAGYQPKRKDGVKS